MLRFWDLDSRHRRRNSRKSADWGSGDCSFMPGVPRELTQQLINVDPIPGLMRT